MDSSARLQSAMEYLMTYGWAILIIAVVLGALFGLGFFNSANLAPKVGPGACQVYRPQGPGSTSFINLEGTCNNELPQYTAVFRYPYAYPAYVNIPNPNSFSKPKQFTVTAWVEPYSTMNYINIFATNCFRFEIPAPPTTIDFHMLNCGNNAAVPGGYTLPNLKNTFSFFAVTFNNASGTMSAYYDGGLEATVGGGQLTYAANYITDMHIGLDGISDIGGTDPMNGTMADVQVYNASLSANEIMALYHEGIGGVPIAPQNLVGWWPLNGNANDYSGNLNNGISMNVIFTSSWTSGYSAP